MKKSLNFIQNVARNVKLKYGAVCHTITIFEFKSTWTANSKWYLINNKEINILI